MSLGQGTGLAETRSPSRQRSPLVALSFALAGWVVPGLGHALAGRRARGLLIFVCVAALVVTGYLQRGYVFSSHSQDAFGLLGFLADIGAGAFYLLAKVIEVGGPDIARAAGDYGTRFIATGGVLNVLTAFDAFAVARGERE